MQGLVTRNSQDTELFATLDAEAHEDPEDVEASPIHPGPHWSASSNRAWQYRAKPHRCKPLVDLVECRRMRRIRSDGPCGSRYVATAVDMLQVFTLLAECHQYPGTMGYAEHFEAIVGAWR